MKKLVFLLVAGVATLMLATAPVGLAEKVDHGLTGFSIDSAYASVEHVYDMIDTGYVTIVDALRAKGT